ncbi:MAG: DNA primase, partial [Bacteriovoracaceae bacterium]
QLIPLSKKGSNLEGICPFHSDTKPSLKVSDSKGMYKCFACGAGGDAIKFVQDFKHLDFIEALKDIANTLGLPFEEFQKEKKKNPRLEMAQRVINASVKLYQKAAGVQRETFENFLTNRKLNQDSVDTFLIGYAPPHNALYKYLQTIPSAERELAIKVALEIGIVKFNPDRQSHYDFFRDRIMFPIHDHSGHIKGFSARALRQDQLPKYLNSSDAKGFFEKNSILFGFYFAKSLIRSLDQVLIVEGHLDVIMMHQFGFKQTVGTMGTALSEHSVRLLANMTKNVYLAMDTDDAGTKAATRINAEFMSLGIMPKFLSFHPAKDPDEFLVKHGQLELTKRIEEAPIFADVIIEELLPKERLENTDHKIAILRQVFELLAPLKEHLSATERIVNVAKSLGLRSDSATILDDYKQYLSTLKDRHIAVAPKPRLPEVEEDIQKQEEAHELQEVEQTYQGKPPSQKEAFFLREIISHPEFLASINKNDFLATLRHDEVKKLFQWLVDIYSEIDDSEYVNIVRNEILHGGYSEAINKIGTEALFKESNRYNDKVIKQLLKDYLALLKLDRLRSIRAELAVAQLKATTQTEIDSIMSEISKLDKEIMNLR